MNSGIYSITHESGKRYIGSAVNLSRRQRDHWNTMRRGASHCSYLQRAWDKYGEGAFEFEVLEECEPEFLISTEQWWINMLAPAYNGNPVAGNCAGRRMRAESRQKIRDSLMGHPVSEETLAKMRAHRLTDEQKALIGERSRGHIASPETRAKMSAARKGKFFIPSETVRRLADARRGTHPTAETIEKLRLSHIGHSHGAETLAKMSAAHTGFRHTPEARARMSEAARLREAAKRKGAP